MWLAAVKTTLNMFSQVHMTYWWDLSIPKPSPSRIESKIGQRWLNLRKLSHPPKMCQITIPNFFFLWGGGKFMILIWHVFGAQKVFLLSKKWVKSLLFHLSKERKSRIVIWYILWRILRAKVKTLSENMIPLPKAKLGDWWATPRERT